MCKQCSLSCRALHRKRSRLISSPQCDQPALSNVTKVLRAPGVIAFSEFLSIKRNRQQVLLASYAKDVVVEFRVVLIKQIGGTSEVSCFTLDIPKAAVLITGHTTLRRG